MKHLFYLFFLVFLVSCGSNEMSLNQKKMLVYDYAIENIEPRLKDPSSLEIPSLSERRDHVNETYQGSNIFIVNSWFRSKNSLGGMVKNTFSCEVEIKDNGNTLSGKNLKIE
tara:strand:+ start:117330 stop:117665 length:336 start_codon:yes stop_codon:yes gene_type:complete